MIIMDTSLREACPDLRLGLISGQVTVAPLSEMAWQSIGQGVGQLTLTADTIREHPVIHAARQVYKALKKDPSRYRLSAEALRRRVMKSQSLYRINNVVDLINWVSLSSGFSIGGYDTQKIQGEILLQRGGTEPYEALGRGELNIQNLPVLYDAQGPFGSPTSDSVRTSITQDTTEVLWVFFDFGASETLQSTMDASLMLLETLAQAQNLKSQILLG